MSGNIDFKINITENEIKNKNKIDNPKLLHTIKKRINKIEINIYKI